MPKLSEEERWVKYRRNYLPGQLERARRRYIGLVREARRMNMLHLLTNKELYEVD